MGASVARFPLRTTTPPTLAGYPAFILPTLFNLGVINNARFFILYWWGEWGIISVKKGYELTQD